MSTICGWLGELHSDHNPQDILTDMVGSQSAGTPHQNESAITPKACLATASFQARNLVYQSEKLLIAIEGNPYWDDNELSSLSAQTGFAEAFAQGYNKWGRSILEKLHGSFSLCLLEPFKQKSFIAVDRLGIRPIAFGVFEQQFIFCSDLNGLIRHPAVCAKIDQQSLFNYLYFHMVPSPQTIYLGVSKLLPGEYVEFNRGTMNRDFYSTIQYSENNTSETALAAELRTQVRKSVRRCMNGDTTGSFLSGGLDSSTVTGTLKSLRSKQTDAFAIGFQAEGYDEMEFARASAKQFGVNLHEYYVTPEDVADSIPSIAQAYDEPFGNASAVPTYYCAKLAREHDITCLLAGDGGDEIFAGNERYVKQKIFELYHHVPNQLRNLIEPLADNFTVLGKLKSYIQQAKIPMPDRMETYNFLHRTPVEEIVHPNFLPQVDTEFPIRRLREVYDRAETKSVLKRMLFLDLKFTLADNDLRKVNRMCELAGIEVRYPLLDDAIVNFSAQLPEHYLIRRFELRSFYRKAFKDFLAPETLSKSKHGFGLPFGIWLATQPRLKEFANENLTALNKREILNPSYLTQLIQHHQTGHASYYGVMIWILVMLEQWLQSHRF